ncbi:MAG: 3'-5' exonuclease [Verrucomicrobia bacterium]|nr:3'-5' exonuclease [Verrucomicrobiota bacterium]
MKTTSDILIIDVETTGVDHLKHACIEIGALLLDRDLNPIQEFSTYIAPWPGAEIQPEAMAVNGISLEELERAPSIAEVVERFDCIFQPGARRLFISGWNVWFDVGFLKVLYSKAERPWPFRSRMLDMQSIVTFHSQIAPQSQAETVKRFLCEEQSHRALGDVQQVAKLLKLFANKFDSTPL